MGAFFDHLLESIEDDHARILTHPVVLGIGAGTLSPERFRFYLGQDYLFLRQYARVAALAAAAADDAADVQLMADMLRDTASVEFTAVGKLFVEFGGVVADLTSLPADPACEAYTNHLLVAAYQGNLMVSIASLLPCQWGYRDIARTLGRSELPEDPRYRSWIEDYLSQSYSDLVDRVVETLERLALTEGSRAKHAAERVFAASERHELNFWNMVLD